MKLRVKALVAGLATIGLVAGLMVALAPSGSAAPVYFTSCHGIPFYDRGYLTAHPNYAANPATSPCAAGQYSMVATGPITLIPANPVLHTSAAGLNVSVLHAVTDFVSTPGATSTSANSTAGSVAVAIPGLTLVAHALYSQTSATMSGGLCNDEVTTGLSSIGDLSINGKEIVVGTAPITIKLGLINIYVNQTLRANNVVTQRALAIQLFGTANTIVVAESQSGVAC